MKEYIEHCKAVAAGSAAREQAVAQADTLSLARSLLADYPGERERKEMFIILSSFFALAAGDDACLCLLKVGSLMRDRKHPVFQELEKSFQGDAPCPRDRFRAR